jgi:hypothetical protein
MVFGDTRDRKFNVTMCEECLGRVGQEQGIYAQVRRYAHMRGMWISASKPDWRLDEVPEGATLVVTDSLTGRTVSFRYDRSLVR